MKLTVERNALAKAMGIVSRAVSSKAPSEMMEHVQLEARSGGLTIRGTDMEMEVSASVAADVEAPGSVTTASATLAEYGNRLPAGASIAMERSDDHQRTLIRSGRSRATLGSFDAAVFPTLGEVDADHGFEIAGRALADIIGRVEFASSKDDTRPMLSGVFLQALLSENGLVLRASATDGYRVGRSSTPCPRSADGMPGIILPKRALAEIKRLADAAGDALVDVRISRALAQFSAAGTVLKTKLIDAIFPDLDRVVPRDNERVVLADAGDLAGAIGRAAILSGDRHRSTHFQFDAGRLDIVSSGHSHGDINESVDVEYDGQPFEVRFNSKFARDILAALDTDTVQIACGGYGSPILWTSPTNGSREYVLMPLAV